MTADRSRTDYSDGQKYNYVESFRKINPSCLYSSNNPLAMQRHSLDVRRSFCGQGDTNSKRTFTEWYVDDHAAEEVGSTYAEDIDTSCVSATRMQQVAMSYKSCSPSSEASAESMSSLSSSSSAEVVCCLERNADRGRDMVPSEDNGGSDLNFNEDFEAERVEVEEDDDDEWEDEDDDEIEGDESASVCNSLSLIRNDETNAIKEMVMRNNCFVMSQDDECDLTHNKHDSRNEIDTSNIMRLGFGKSNNRVPQHLNNNQVKEENTYRDLHIRSKYEKNLPVDNQRHQQRAAKPTANKKISFDSIKVPSIEKERVRFACNENGEWAEIGRGSYGCVYLGLLDGTVEVAIKDFYESSSWDLVIHEARMLLFLQETGITPALYGLRRRFDVQKEPSEYCIIMEYFGDGRTLFNVMSDKIALQPEEWLDVVGQLVAGLRLIHSKNVLINDLKADNILIDLSSGRKTIRYIDVGMATYKQGLTFQLPQDQMNKYNFLAPEVREGSHTSYKSDIYSLGYMLEQIARLAGTTLTGLDKLITQCTDKDPNNRPNIDDIVSQVHWYIVSKTKSRESSPPGGMFVSNSV